MDFIELIYSNIIEKSGTYSFTCRISSIVQVLGQDREAETTEIHVKPLLAETIPGSECVTCKTTNWLIEREECLGFTAKIGYMNIPKKTTIICIANVIIIVIRRHATVSVARIKVAFLLITPLQKTNNCRPTTHKHTLDDL